MRSGKAHAGSGLHILNLPRGFQQNLSSGKNGFAIRMLHESGPAIGGFVRAGLQNVGVLKSAATFVRDRRTKIGVRDRDAATL